MTTSGPRPRQQQHAPTIDYPLGEPTRLDLHPGYASLLAEAPMIRVNMPHGGTAWLATGYEAVREVMSSPAVSRAAAAENPGIPRLLPEPPPAGTIMTIDPPEHSRLRRLVSKAFTARRVEAMRPRIQKAVDELLDGMARDGAPADLVRHLAVPLPVRVICEIMGVPVEDEKHFRAFTEGIMGTTAFDSDEVKAAMGSFFGYFAQLIAERRANPTDDLLGALVTARDDEDSLSEQELVWLGVALLIGGHETTLNQITNFAYVLLGEPERAQELREHPELMPRAVEELLRYVPTGAGSAFASLVTEDTVLHGVPVAAGEAVIVDLGAANRDPAAFGHPDELDFHRETNHHLAMGHGAHFCLGAQLARMELQIALGTLLDRFPGLRLAVPEEGLSWRSGSLIRGLEELPVAW
ncbi:MULTISPECIES: cytochrome P450 [unclassified Streptomyces]|uniref:cytochrome P450 n=1 Tax=unclassified Streptomyces TaxID=2593676 RepID=UPI002DDB0318|nr:MULTISPECIES: cytochrome P450 [unclassified Streptomyces]WSA95500.1 cytochrome P450 [Streptomyces sp. NBC_01795]WSB79916.1 cytochrome P450 [Streptomyces sp. NBC_01775]WSS11877.1 cytochrome P450 [Streptomyces sp. NBC_01186]WSS40591.1 cytochrome P450 [Streptomyces sp. NBC_01187]